MLTRLGALSSLALLAVTLPSGAAPVPNRDDTWTDGLFPYTMSPPVEGYFVPRTVFKKGYQVPVKEVLEASRPMTKEELRQYTRTGQIKTNADDFPLFVFENHKVNVFLWKGKLDGTEQQIIPRVWTGEIWSSKGYGQSRAEAVEHVFYHPADQTRCYVLLYQSNGQVGKQRILTDRIWFGHFPPVNAIIKEGMKTADAVVYLPDLHERNKRELLDCLKGDITAAAFKAVPGIERIDSNSLVFLKRDGKGWALRSSYQEERAVFHADHGELRLSIPQVRDVLAKNDWLNEYLKPPPMRWHLARQAADAPRDAACALRLVNPNARRDEWLMFELVVGAERPGALYTHPVTRSQRDGGNPLFRFQLERDGKKEELTTLGRFGVDSLTAAEPRKSDGMGCSHHFIDCGPGVVKLAVKPKDYPWKATIAGTYMEHQRFGRGVEMVHTTAAVKAEVK